VNIALIDDTTVSFRRPHAPVILFPVLLYGTVRDDLIQVTTRHERFKRQDWCKLLCLRYSFIYLFAFLFYMQYLLTYSIDDVL